MLGLAGGYPASVPRGLDAPTVIRSSPSHARSVLSVFPNVLSQGWAPSLASVTGTGEEWGPSRLQASTDPCLPSSAPSSPRPDLRPVIGRPHGQSAASRLGHVLGTTLALEELEA